MMIGFRLQLKQLPDGRLIFTIPFGYKILLFLIGLLILISLIITRQEGSGTIFVRENTIPLIICFLSFLGAAYHERWIFDKEQNQIVHQNGIFALHSKKVYGFSDFEGVEVCRMMPPAAGHRTGRSFGGRFGITLILRAVDNRGYRLETYRMSHRDRVGAVAREIADYCGLPFTDLSATS